MILAVLEAQDAGLRKISFEVLAAARRADELQSSGGIVALLIGPGARAAAGEAAAQGVEKVLFVDGPAFSTYATEAYAKAILTARESVSAGTIVVGASAFGRDVAPRLAAALGAGLLTDVTELHLADGRLAARRAAYSQKVLADVAVRSETAIVAIRPNAFQAAAGAGGSAPVEELSVEVDASKVRARVREVRRQEAGRVDLSEADVVVAGGRGLREPENFRLVEELADALGGAVGATRAIVDSGWRPHQEQIGQTGKNVAPALYIAVGISGAVQHTAGMSSSRTIVSINRDPEAPIFQLSDYGIVGDAMEILPQLTEEVRRIRS